MTLKGVVARYSWYRDILNHEVSLIVNRAKCYQCHTTADLFVHDEPLLTHVSDCLDPVKH